MANKFFVWKDAECKGVNPVWVELSGEDFYKFINNPKNAKRRFIKEYFEDDSDMGYYKFEVTEEGYKKWRTLQKQKERSEDVLIANNKKHRLLDKDEIDENAVRAIPCVVSFDAPLTDDEETTYHDIIPDFDIGYTESEKKMLLEKIYRIMQTLSIEEQRIIDNLYFNNPKNLSDNEIARQMNIPTTTFNRKKIIILKKFQEKWDDRHFFVAIKK